MKAKWRVKHHRGGSSSMRSRPTEVVMPTFAMFTRVAPGAAATPMSLPHLEQL